LKTGQELTGLNFGARRKTDATFSTG